MIFRTKFAKENWFLIFVYALNLVLELYFDKLHLLTTGMAFRIASWSVLILFTVYTQLFSRLELDSGYLRYRSIFKTSKVPLADVTLVRNYGFTTGQLVIEFSPPLPKAELKSIVVNPKDRSGFLSAMRQFAPQAVFE